MSLCSFQVTCPTTPDKITCLPYLLSFYFLCRCCLCIPVTQPSAQRACASNAGHSQAAFGTWLQAPRVALASAWRLDKGGRCSSHVAHEAACCSAGGGDLESRNNGGGYISFPHDVCWTNWGEYVRSLNQQQQNQNLLLVCLTPLIVH